jgi:hypothetical protein
LITAILYWAFLFALAAVSSILIVLALELGPLDGEEVTPTLHIEEKKKAISTAEQIQRPKGNRITSDRFIVVMDLPPTLTDKEKRAIARTVQEWNFLQDAWEEGERLIDETERGR